MVLPAILRTNRERILELAARHGATEVRVFGSFARGQERAGSDVDFLVRATARTSPWFPAGLVLDLEELLGRRVDVLTEAAIHPRIREAVLRDAEPL